MSGTIQVLAGIALVIILFIIGFYIYNREQLATTRMNSNLQRVTPIFSGIYDLSTGSTQFNTLNPNTTNYRNLNVSINQKAGTEFTYNFWLYLDLNKYQNTGATFIPINKINGSGLNASFYTDQGLGNPLAQNNANNYQPVVLFVRGENVARQYNGLCFNPTASSTPVNNTNANPKVDVLVKCPIVKLEHGGDVLSVEFNTIYGPDVVKQNARQTCNDPSYDWESANAYKVAIKGLSTRAELQQKWFMVTIVLQDSLPSAPMTLRNKIRAQIYINGSTEFDKYIDDSFSFYSSNTTNDSSLKINSGDLYVAPVITQIGQATPLTKQVAPANSREIMIADLTYFNYSVDSSTLSSIYQSGFNTQFANIQQISNSPPTYLGMSNTNGITLSELQVS
jgi:hypothetical protein